MRQSGILQFVLEPAPYIPALKTGFYGADDNLNREDVKYAKVFSSFNNKSLMIFLASLVS
jgi:hypothetical protein